MNREKYNKHQKGVPMTSSLKPPYVEKVDERGDLQVWIVDGCYIRGHKDEDLARQRVIPLEAA